MPRSVPTVRLRRLGRDLRQLREARGLSADTVAAQLGWSGSKVTRIETARTRPTAGDVALLLGVYGVPSDVRASLIQLAHDAQRRGWWTEFGDVFITSYVALEDEAISIRQWEPQLIPGLLQTEDYVRALLAEFAPDSHDDVERRIRARVARQAVLSRPDAPELTAIIAEPVLRWPIGGPETMRGQLRSLLEAGRRPNVTIRVLPMSAGAHAGLDGSVILFSFGEEDFPDVAYTEGPAGGTYVESADQVQRVSLNWDRIADKALSAEESAAWIADLVRSEPVS
jgi:transcriptional regulator with XRE-family HTH domain